MSTLEERKKARGSWPIRVFRLGEEPLTDDRDTSTVDERIAQVTALTLAQWTFARRELPRYSRASMPGRIIRPPHAA